MIKNICTVLFVFFSLSIFSQEFTTNWNTTLLSTGSSANNQITIPTNSAYTYNYTIDWGDGSTDSNVTGNITHTYATPNSYTIRISGDFPAIYFNNTGDRNKITEILDWGTIQWQSMEDAFNGCENLNFDAINSPDLSQVTSLQNMFKGAISFNGIINNWDISNITNISGIFWNARIFNRPLDSWNTISVTDMSHAFRGAGLYNEPLDNWNVSNVTTLAYMFYGASSFNQNINNWDISNVTDLSGTFYSTGSFNSPLNSWNVSNVTTMELMFSYSDFDLPINNWNVSNVTNMSGMFAGSAFSQPLNNWNVSNVTNMSSMFQRTRNFNQPLTNWNVSNVTDMSSMFDGYYWTNIYNQPLDGWDVSNVTNMSYMFRDTRDFNQPLSSWNVSNVTNMQGMFNDADVFNQDITGWDVSNVTNMNTMFQNAPLFNQAIGVWNVSNVTNMSNMFNRAIAFNQPLNSWDVAKVTNMSGMFTLNTIFNQNLSNWNTALVTNMSTMFNGASAFNQNLSSWSVGNITNMTNMLSGSALSKTNYDNTLIGWGVQTVKTNVNLGATSLYYCDGRNERQNLIDNYNWTITGDIIDCDFVLCTSLVSPKNGDLNVPSNANLIWAAVPGATGYRISVRRENGGSTQVIYNNEDVGNVVGVNFTNDLTPGDTVFVTIVPYNANGPAVGCTEESFSVIPSWVNSPDAFKLTFDTSITDTWTSNNRQVRLELNDGYPGYFDYDFSIDWGDDQFDNNVTNAITHTYLTPGIYTVTIIGTYPAHYYSYFSDRIKLISIDQWGTQQWKSMEDAFYYCSNMEYNATDIPDLSDVTSMNSMFSSTTLFNGNINNWDVSNVTDMGAMFIAATAFNQPLDNWDVSNVEDMRAMFLGADSFNQPLNTWNTSSVTDMSRMFEQADIFNQPIDSWDVSNVTNMESMFERAEEFNQPLNSWNVSNVTNMAKMFDGFVTDMAFNQPLDNWDVSNVTNMAMMFRRAVDFNQPLNTWNVSLVTDMSYMFQSATRFNQPLDNWNTSAVLNMEYMFSSASAFNQNINSWNVTNVLNTRSMFNNAIVFNQPLNNWDVNSVVNMSSMFQRAQAFNQPLENWDVSAVANMSSMFKDAILYNQPINSWNVSSVTLMPSMFENAEAFNQNINNWNVGSVTQMNAMFKDTDRYNQPLSNWDTGEVLTMKDMFNGAAAFNQNINNWNTSFVTTMEAMFRSAVMYNQPLSSWNVASVTTMRDMFSGATAFNQNIDGWNVRNVISMENMFNGATSFNETINSWRVSGVLNMNYMFRNASAYNQSLDRWDLGSVSMRSMFQNASSFDQELSSWNVSQVNNMQNMLDNTALTRENYDNTLIGWSEQTLSSGISLGAVGLVYCDALEERQSMISNFGWIISGDILDCPIPECTQLISPLNGETNVPVNTNLTWEPALYARGYNLTVRTEPGNVVIVNNETVNETYYEFSSDFLGDEIVYVTITPFNDEGAASSCIEESFVITSTTTPTAPECTTLTSPLNNNQNVAIDSGLSWNPISNADGYRITVGTTTGGNDILNNFDTGNDTFYDFATDLAEDTTYYVSITPYNEIGDAISCVEESFKTELIPVPPTCTTLTSPLNGATNVPLNATLSWNAVPNATGYLVVVGTTQGGIEVVNNIDVANSTTFSFTEELRPNRTHYVTIIPYNEVGDATGCVEESFRTGAAPNTDPPTCTTLTAPLNMATNVALDTNISWNASATATGYKLTIGTTSGGNDILATTDVLNTTTYNLSSDLPEGTVIYVSILPYNTYGDAISCVEETFTTETLPTIPNCTSLNSPVNNATGIAVDTNISWDAVTDATGYTISITSTSGNNNIANFDNGNSLTYNPSINFENDDVVTVTIIPYNTVGAATSCTSESFTIVSPTLMIPNCTVLNNPVNTATGIAVDANISWDAIPDATGYSISITSTSGNNNITNYDNGNSLTYNPPIDFENDDVVTVTIIPYNTAGAATGCTSESFTIVSPIPTIPSSCANLINPSNEALNVVVDTPIVWEEVIDATGYRITIGTTTNGADILSNEDVGFLTSYNLTTDLPYDTRIYVSITPYNAQGDAIGCLQESFTTEVEPLVESEYGFSPNGDGINDFWEIKGIENSPENTVNIYNRWGDLVFTITNYDNQNNVFRGEANNLTGFGASTLPNGTYFFHIQISGTHNLKKLKGFVVLKR